MKTKRFNQVCMLDHCYPDCFSGYSYPVVSIPTFKGMTNEELSEAIEQEMNGCWDLFVNEDENSYTDEEMEFFDAFCEKLMEEPEKKNFEDLEDFDDSCYLYLALCFPVQRYGMTFLNQ